jgi:hypothetical protein
MIGIGLTGMVGIGVLELIIILAVPGAVAGVIALVVFFAVARSSGSQQPPGPNLQPCPDCGKTVSVRAIRCRRSDPK